MARRHAAQPPRERHPTLGAIPVVEEFADGLAKRMDAEQHALAFEALDRTASAHFIGGMPIGHRLAPATSSSRP